MSGLPLSELRQGILGVLSETPLSEQEIRDLYPDTDRTLMSNLLLQMAAQGQIWIASGTDARKWTSRNPRKEADQ